MAAGTRTAAGMRHNVFFRVDVISYSSAIIACEQGRKWKHALQSRQTVLFEREGNRCQNLFASAGFIIDEAAMAPQRHY